MTRTLATLQALIAENGFGRILSLLADEASERAAKKESDGDRIGSQKWLDVAGQLSRTAKDASAIL